MQLHSMCCVCSCSSHVRFLNKRCLQDIKGKVALIVGASTRLGRGVADLLAQAGMMVVYALSPPPELSACLLPRFVCRSMQLHSMCCVCSCSSHVRFLNKRCLQDIKGKVALIVGASTGLGRGVADRLAQAGMTVIGTSRNPQEYLNSKSCTYTRPGDRCKPGGWGCGSRDTA
jgi:5,10-methylene-tetrahydrofolate dehydrogenase/methenyl tetrahydrofolate cyclohydrolase